MLFKLIDLSYINSEDVQFVNDCYEIFTQVYTPILASSDEVLQPDYFFKSRFLSVLIKNSNVIAFSLHSIYDCRIDKIYKSSYFIYSTSNVNNILKNKKVASVEWLTVNPSERGKFSKFQPNEILLSLFTKISQRLNIDTMIGFSRTDLKADKTAEKFGFKASDTILRHGIECKIMICHSNEITEHPISKVRTHINTIFKGEANESSAAYDNKSRENEAFI